MVFTLKTKLLKTRNFISQEISIQDFSTFRKLIYNLCRPCKGRKWEVIISELHMIAMINHVNYSLSLELKNQKIPNYIVPTRVTFHMCLEQQKLKFWIPSFYYFFPPSMVWIYWKLIWQLWKWHPVKRTPSYSIFQVYLFFHPIHTFFLYLKLRSHLHSSTPSFHHVSYNFQFLIF